MAYDGWVKFGQTELFNVSRTVQLAEIMGIDQVWVSAPSVEWIDEQLGESSYDDVATAPWYDPQYPASAEFAGVLPLSLQGLDDSTLSGEVTEYITDGGNPGRSRNSTLAIVASVAIVAQTSRGAEFGKRWLDKILRGERGERGEAFCAGADLRYFRYVPEPGTDAEQAIRQNVKLTRGTSVTRKRTNSCSAVWMVTFTWTAGDPYEYSDPLPSITEMGGEMLPAPDSEVLRTNLATEPRVTEFLDFEFISTDGAGYNRIDGTATSFFPIGEETQKTEGAYGPLVGDRRLGHLTAIYGDTVLSDEWDVAFTAQSPDAATRTKPAFPVVAGKKYAVTWMDKMFLSDPALVPTTSLVVRWYRADGTSISTYQSPAVNKLNQPTPWATSDAPGPDPNAGWEISLVEITAPAEAVYAAMQTRSRSTVAPSAHVDMLHSVTALAIFDVTGLSTYDASYFDGEVPESYYDPIRDGDIVHLWTGETNRSTSREVVQHAGEFSETPATGPHVVAQGSETLVEIACPVFDYSPIQDPLYPALIEAPTAPDFYPSGWNIAEGMEFIRQWARVSPVEPSVLDVVPIIKLVSNRNEARRVRISFWSYDTAPSKQCDPLFSIVINYLPQGLPLYIDGQRQAVYVWDGGDIVRRADGVSFGPEGQPVNWSAFNSDKGFLVTLDHFSLGDEGEGYESATLSLDFVQKSD